MPNNLLIAIATSGRNPDFLKARSAKSTAGLNVEPICRGPFAPKFTCVDRTDLNFYMIVSRQPEAHNVNVDHRIRAAFVDIAKFSDERVGAGREIG